MTWYSCTRRWNPQIQIQMSSNLNLMVLLVWAQALTQVVTTSGVNLGSDICTDNWLVEMLVNQLVVLLLYPSSLIWNTICFCFSLYFHCSSIFRSETCSLLWRENALRTEEDAGNYILAVSRIRLDVGAQLLMTDQYCFSLDGQWQ